MESYLKPLTGDQTPYPNTMDWLWWHPNDPSAYQSGVGIRLFHCWNCDVTWREYYEIQEKKLLKCWCCGRFHKRPKI